LALRFGPDLADPKEQNHRNSELFRGFFFARALSVHPEMVDFGFQQGPSEFSTAGIARYVED